VAHTAIESQQLGYRRIGIGLRLKGEILTLKSNLDIGSLMGIAMQAKFGNLIGTLSVSVIGMDSPEITQLFPMPSQIDETSVMKAMEALAAIKAKLNDPGTFITPHILAVRNEQGEDWKEVAGTPDYLIGVPEWFQNPPTDSIFIFVGGVGSDSTSISLAYEKAISNAQRVLAMSFDTHVQSLNEYYKGMSGQIVEESVYRGTVSFRVKNITIEKSATFQWGGQFTVYILARVARSQFESTSPQDTTRYKHDVNNVLEE